MTDLSMCLGFTQGRGASSAALPLQTLPHLHSDLILELLSQIPKTYLD